MLKCFVFVRLAVVVSLMNVLPALAQQALPVDKIERIPYRGFDITYRKTFPGMEFTLSSKPRVCVYPSEAQAERAVAVLADHLDKPYRKKLEEIRKTNADSWQRITDWAGIRHDRVVSRDGTVNYYQTKLMREDFRCYDQVTQSKIMIPLSGEQVSSFCRSLSYETSSQQMLCNTVKGSRVISGPEERFRGKVHHEFRTYIARRGRLLCWIYSKAAWDNPQMEANDRNIENARVMLNQHAVSSLLDSAEQFSLISRALNSQIATKLAAKQALDRPNLAQLINLFTTPVVGQRFENSRENAKRVAASVPGVNDPLYVGIARKYVSLKQGRSIKPIRDAVQTSMKELLPQKQFKSSDSHYFASAVAIDSYGKNLVLALLSDRLEAGEKPTEQQVADLLAIAYRCKDVENAEWLRLIKLLGLVRPAETRMRLELSADHKEIRPDGKSRVRVTVEAFTYVPGEAGSRMPMVKLPLRALILSRDIPAVGSLEQQELATDANGKATVVYVAPKPEDLLDGTITAATIQLKARNLHLSESIHVQFLFDKGKLQVKPHYGSGISSVGHIPADKRFPATIRFILKDRDGKVQPDQGVTFQLLGGQGILEANGAAQRKVTVVTDLAGAAECRFRYTGPTAVRAPSIAKIEISSKSLKKPVIATVKAGIDLAIHSARPRGKGTFSAGESIPVAIEVYDRFYGKDANIEPLLNHWKDDPATGQSKLWLRLNLRAAGNVPSYLSDMLGKPRPPSPLREFAWPREFKDGSRCLMIQGVGHMRLPEVKLSTSGQNLYDLRVEFVTKAAEGEFVPVAEKWNVNNRSLLVIPAGVRADATYIWLVENPFAANSDSARFLRAIAGLHGLGESVLNIADAITAINRGDTEELTAMLVSQVKGKVMARYGGKHDADTVVGTLAEAHTQIAATAALLSALPGSAKTLDAKVEERITKSILKGTGLKGYKLVVSYSDEPLVIDGKVLPAGSKLSSKQIVSGVKANGVAVYNVPANSTVKTSSKVRVYSR